MDIDSWLRGIGLAQYAEMFRANDIDCMILRELTDQDLEKMGVASSGPPPQTVASDRRIGQRTRGHCLVMPALIPAAVAATVRRFSRSRRRAAAISR